MTNGTRSFGLDERGVAAVMALIVVLALSLLVGAFLTISAFEPRISQNLADSTQARAVADAGIEWAFDQLVGTPSWNTLLTGAASCATPVTPAGWSNVTIPGVAGSFTVSLRNDCQAGDNQITGGVVDPGTATNDTNGIVILTSIGNFQNAIRRIQVVMQRAVLPPFPGAVNLPGFQDDTYVANTNFSIDGRDYDRTGALTANPMHYGIAMQPGIQQDISPTTYEQHAEAAFDTTGKLNNVEGLSQTTGALTTGVNTIASDPTLNPTVMANFLSQVASNPKTQILQSTLACPIVMTGSSSSPTQPTLTNGCSMNQTVNLGTTSNPALVYFRGELDPSSNFTGLKMNGTIQGAGILIVEDGDMLNNANLRWDGIIMVTGRYVGVGFMPGSQSTIYGSLVSMETIWNETPGYMEFYLNPTSATFRYSKQNLDMVQGARSLHSLYGWRQF